MPVSRPIDSKSALFPEQGYGLRQNSLSQWATLAQSLSSIAPTASPAMVIPLVIAVSGPSSWIVYLLATVGILLVALHINVFAGSSTSPGSLYAFVQEELGPWFGMFAGWAVLIAYVGTASAVTGGIVQYAQGISGGFLLQSGGAILLIGVSVFLATVLAYRNVELSTRFMLWTEALSIAVILLLFLYPSHEHRLFWDATQFSRHAFRLAPIRAGLILATFSFVGFESATSLGTEAKSPLRTIPRAVLGTALLSGILFLLSSYSEVAAFAGKLDLLTGSSTPLQLLAQLKGAAWLAPILTIGAVVSFFACTLACITAAARAALLLSAHGTLPVSLGRAHRNNQTPHIAIIVSGVATFLPATWLTLRHTSGFDLYGWLGTIATFGFVTAYLLVVLAAIMRLKRRRKLAVWRIAVGTVTLGFLGWAFVGSLNLGAKGPERWLAPTYFALLIAGALFGVALRRFRHWCRRLSPLRHQFWIPKDKRMSVKGAVLMSSRLYIVIRRNAAISFALLLWIFLALAPDRAYAGPAANESARPQSLLLKLPSGITLNYFVQGDPKGIPVVLLHGAGDSWHSYDLVLPRLPEKYRVYAVTLRGHGWSDHPAEGFARTDFAADITAFLEQLNLQNVTLVGHSLGSFVAQQVAADDKGRIVKLVLIGSGPGIVQDQKARQEIQSVFSGIQDPVPCTFARDFQASTIYAPVPPAFFETLVNEALKAPASTWHGLGKSFQTQEAAPLERIKIPTLIFWGDKDNFFKKADEDLLVSKIPGSKLVVYPETGHALHWERPERFSADLLNFLGK
jgi:amino acid transporter/pimeloyl-ACP methyl ester carboxylesterase